MDETQEVSTKVHNTALVLANAAVLGAMILRKVAGNSISTALNGSVLTRDACESMMTSSLIEKIEMRKKGTVK